MWSMKVEKYKHGGVNQVLFGDGDLNQECILKKKIRGVISGKGRASGWFLKMMTFYLFSILLLVHSY